MAQTVTQYVKCVQCGGTGIYSTVDSNGVSLTIPCPWPGCVGGYIENGKHIVDPSCVDVRADLLTLSNSVGGLTADVASLGDLLKETYELCQKILEGLPGHP
jgi:hypothetical protein